MALIGHWPLNGNTNDISGNGKHGSAHGTLTSSTAGKIGLTYIFENNENGVNISNNNFSGLTSYTMSAWINPAGNHRNYNGTILSSGNWNSTCWAFGVNQTNTAIDAAGRGYNKYINYTFTLNAWTHILSVVSNGVSKVYVNGNYLGQINVTSTLASDATNTFIGRETYAGGHFSFNGKINDVRIYDHALTDFEVQELYKTKIIHYTFDNEVESTTNIINTSPLSIYNNYGVPASITTLPITRNGAPIYRVSMTATSTSLSSFRNSYANQGIMSSTNSFAANTPHTSSIMWRVKQGPPNIKVRGTPSNIGGWSDRGTYLTDDGWNRTIATRAPYGSTVTDSLFWSFISPDIQLDDVIIIEWTSPQLETKDHFTEFTRTNRDRKQISDLSDFRNNGTLTGDLEITKESAIGNGSIIFDSSNAKININTINPLPSEVSISYWRKTVPEVNGSGWLPFVGQTTSHYIMATSGGTGAFYHSGNVGDRTKNIYIDGVKIGTSTPPVQDNNWHHYVITGLDLSAWTQFNINGYSSSWNMLGNMDDFRMYATTLTDRDIKDLYETKAEIDKGSTLYAKDFTDSVNLLDPDIFYGYANSGTPEKQVFDNRKVWVPYPARFHPNGALRGLFKENTRYKIHLVYTHFTYYSAIENYVPGGLTIRYTDGTEHHLIYTPTGQDPDWRTLNYITPEGKTVSNIWVYYYLSYPLYVSEESFMVEYNKDGISNKGISEFLDYSTVGITDGLVGYWPLSENSKDYSGSNYDLTDPNINVSIRDGARFTGTSDQKLFVENFPKYTSNFTWSVDFMNTVQNTTQQFVVSLGRDCCDAFGMSIVVINGIINVYIGTGTVINTNISCVNLLRNVVVSVDSANVRVYVDGIQTNITAIPLFNYGASTALVVGKMSYYYTSDTTYFPFNGIVENFKIFNRALTPEEIAIEYNTMFKNEVQIHESGVLYAKDLRQY